jgi:hypothetical protein|tara:strand:- start:777 stop:968 length:192 start_codon:yes stop_codon:yes gene_type:complete
MQPGDLVRYREMVNHRTEEKTDWRLGVLIKKEYNTCEVMTTDARLIRLWSALVQKAGKKDAGR